MNAHYQYFLATGTATDNLSSPPQEVLPPQEEAPSGGGSTPPPTSGGTATDGSTGGQGGTYQGDNTQQRGTTTINIFGAGTSTRSSAEQISVDPNTGEISTSTTDPNATLGGGGGGFGAEESGSPAKKVKTYIPLLLMAAGVAVLVFNPFKKLN